jgi:dual specificity MAP kinase phosphatase
MFEQRGGAAGGAVQYNVYVIAEPFEAFERDPTLTHLVAVDSSGFSRNRVDFLEREREEMARLTRASPIAEGVWLGNDADVPRRPDPEIKLNGNMSASIDSMTDLGEMDDGNPFAFSICVEAHDQAIMADDETLRRCDHILAELEAECEEQCDPQSPTSSESSFVDDSDVQTHEAGRDFRQSTDRRARPSKAEVQRVLRPHVTDLLHLECLSTSQVRGPSAGRFDTDAYVDLLVSLVDFIARQANPGKGRIQKRVLIYAQDGYTDSSVIALSYIMCVRQCSLADAYLYLQNTCGRSFFVYKKDLAVLERVHDRLFEMRHHPSQAPSNNDSSSFSFFPRQSLHGRKSSFFGRSSSPQAAKTLPAPAVYTPTPNEKAQRHPWFYDARFDGHFPSRILAHLYLGNVAHAFNAGMLRELGITHVCSIGESALVPPQAGCNRGAAAPTLWEEERAGRIQVLDLQGISDDGIDPIKPYFEQTIKFIEEARAKGGKCLVHCRVGVSRSATLVIAYCMRALAMDLVSAYLLVRSRRLNILIQVGWLVALLWCESVAHREFLCAPAAYDPVHVELARFRGRGDSSSGARRRLAVHDPCPSPVRSHLECPGQRDQRLEHALSRLLRGDDSLMTDVYFSRPSTCCPRAPKIPLSNRPPKKVHTYFYLTQESSYKAPPPERPS